MSRRFAALAAVVLLFVGLGVGRASADAPANACDSAYASNTTQQLKAYTDCRFDRLEQQLTRIENQTKPAPSSSPSATPKPTVTPTPSATVTPTPTTTTAPAAFPGPSNTGHTKADCPNGLTKWAGGAVQSNTTYRCIDFGFLDVGSTGTPVTNVTIYGSYFHGANPQEKLVGVWGDKITFSWCTFAPGTTQLPTPFAQSYQYGIAANGAYNTFAKALKVDHSDFYGFGNAIDTDGSTQAAPQIFEANWFHDAATGGDYHVDGIGTENGHGRGSYVSIIGNTIESAGNTNGVAFQAGQYDHMTVTGNLFGGFGYTVAILGGATDVTFTGNTFSTRLPVAFGPLYPANFWTTTGSSWRNNRWLVPAGAAWGTPANSGKFWIPSGDASPTNDAPFVSSTDFTG